MHEPSTESEELLSTAWKLAKVEYPHALQANDRKGFIMGFLKGIRYQKDQEAKTNGK